MPVELPIELDEFSECILAGAVAFRFIYSTYPSAIVFTSPDVYFAQRQPPQRASCPPRVRTVAAALLFAGTETRLGGWRLLGLHRLAHTGYGSFPERAAGFFTVDWFNRSRASSAR